MRLQSSHDVLRTPMHDGIRMVRFAVFEFHLNTTKSRRGDLSPFEPEGGVGW
jgi:hypothetical protein